MNIVKDYGEYFTVYDMGEVLQVHEYYVRRAIKLLRIKGIKDSNHQQFFSKEQFGLIEAWCDKNCKQKVFEDDKAENHPLVTDKRFLKLSFFPDVRLRDDD